MKFFKYFWFAHQFFYQLPSNEYLCRNYAFLNWIYIWFILQKRMYHRRNKTLYCWHLWGLGRRLRTILIFSFHFLLREYLLNLFCCYIVCHGICGEKCETVSTRGTWKHTRKCFKPTKSLNDDNTHRVFIVLLVFVLWLKKSQVKNASKKWAKNATNKRAKRRRRKKNKNEKIKYENTKYFLLNKEKN